MQDQLARHGGSISDREVAIDGPGGEHYVLRLSGRRLPDSPADNEMILLTIEDFTERRRSIEQQFQAFLNALPEPMMTVADNGRIRWVNTAFQRLFGYGGDELVGQSIDMLVPADRRERHMQMHRTFLRDPIPRPMGRGLEILGVTKDGHALPLEIALSPITTSLGLLVVAAVRDISERRRVEQSLNDARTEAQRANRAKSRFLRAASHDLRQPLQVMRLLQGALAAKITDATGKGMLHRLEDTADAMNGVLAAFVDVSQIETGTITPSIVEFPVFGLLTRLRTDFGALANAKGLILRVVPSSATVRSDPRLLERILGNLVSNAVKCTRNGKVLLGCRRHGATLRIEVWDTGAGIAPEHDSDILEEFYQVSPSDNRSDISFDIGLYIVEQLARLLGHPLSVRSSPGKGAMFSIAVPLLEHRVGDNGATASTAAATDNAPLVLVVEDDEAQRDALRLLLSVHGYTVETAATGPEAVIQVSGSSGFRPDIVLAGYNLGGAMTGVEIVRQIASRIGRPVPAVIMTGDLSATTSCAVADAGMKLLHKPVRLDALLDTVGDLAAMAAGQQAETRHPLLAADARTGPATIAIIDDDVGVGTAASLGVGEPERYLRVCCLTRGWMRGLDCEAGENRG